MTPKQELSTMPLKLAAPAVGYEVFTVDGMPVGMVSKVSGGFIRVDARLRPDFWLRLDDAINVEGRAVTLAYPREALQQHKHSEPAVSSDDFMPAGAEPLLLDEEEQLAQRELMERELAQQRRRLAERTASGTEPGAGLVEESRRAWPCSGATCARCIAAVIAMAALLFGVRMWRRRRRREPASGPPLL